MSGSSFGKSNFLNFSLHMSHFIVVVVVVVVVVVTTTTTTTTFESVPF
jgi:cytochrome c oxidase assembly factor CtaG